MTRVQVSVATGEGNFANPGETIDGAAFGAKYSSFRSFDNFMEMVGHIRAQHVIWPGGAFAEIRPERYGCNFHDLFNPNLNRPGLTELFEEVNANGQALSVTLPSVRFLGDLQGMRQCMGDFMDRLLGGDLGPLPAELTLEIGNEYYADFDLVFDFNNGLFRGMTPAEHYGVIASAMVEVMSDALNDSTRNPDGLDVKISVQHGRNEADDIAIRDAMSPQALREIDMLSHHRYAWPADDNTSRIAHVEWALDAWGEAIRDAGGETPELFLSGWNAASYTRVEALRDYVAAKAADGNVIDPDTIDLEGRTNAEFEAFYQDQLAARAYGMGQAGQVLDLFSQYMAIGADAATTYGFDMIHPGAHFLEVDDTIYTFASGEMLRLMFESLDGTRVLESFDVGVPQAGVPTGLDIYAYEERDRIVVFVSRDGHLADEGELTVRLSLDGLADGPAAVWAETLSTEVLPNWRSLFGGPDNPDVDESPEANVFSVARTVQFSPDVVDGAIEFDIEESDGIVRLVIARTPNAVARIAGWAGENFTLRTASGDHYAEVGASDDRLSGDDSNNMLIAGAGNDTLRGQGGDDRLFGQDDDDLLDGQLGDDQLWAGAGRDSVSGGLGDDVLGGGQGNDRMSADGGHDMVWGGAGDDTMFGGWGRDTMGGGAGDDRIFGGAGDDFVWGGSGDDSVFGRLGNDTLVGRDDNDRLLTGAGDDEAWGGAGDDSLDGGVGNDRLGGAEGEDQLFGGNGDDVLYGGAGGDRLNGGNGNDRLFGGSGADNFVFSAGRDLIRDFEDDVDVIELHGSELGISGLDGQGVIDHFASTADGDTILDFGGGNQLFVIGLGVPAALTDDIIIV